MQKTWASITQVVAHEGVNSSFRPDQIGQAQMSWAKNVTIRDGKPRTRQYKFVQRATLPAGMVQGAGYFSRDGGKFILSIWGQLWRVLVNANNVTVDSIPLVFRNSSTNKQAWMCETAGSFLIQDGQSDCIIYDGSTARRAVPALNEVPLGRQMAYGNGRLCVAVSGNKVKAGDITTQVFQSELKFTETNYLNGGGSFLFTYNITGLAFLPSNNTFSGYGSLLVFGTQFMNSLHMEITARDRWSTTDGFEVVVVPIGTCGQDTIIKVNQDLYFRDAQGEIWSVRSASSDAGSPGNAPLSREVSRIVDFETEQLVQYSSAVYFDNRLLFLASPVVNRYGSASYQNIISLDAATLATMRGKQPPAYDGVAEGLQFVRLMSGRIQGVNRAFAISTDDDGENRLWEIMPAAEADAYFNDSGVLTPYRVQGQFESRRFVFGETLHKLMRLDLWPCEVAGEVDVQVYYRTDNRSQWRFWSEFSMCATMDNADDEWLNLEAQERGRVKSLTMPDTNDEIESMANNVGFGFQVRVVWQGQMLLDRLTIYANDLQESAYSNIPDLAVACVKNSVVNNQLSYAIPVGSQGSAYTDQDLNVYVDSFGNQYTD